LDSCCENVADRAGILFIVSAPSGAGKGAIIERVMARDDRMTVSVSATTRAPRPGEKEGTSYYFLSREEFLRRVSAGEFAEWAEVHEHLYGTLRSELARLRALGRDVFMEVDVQGMFNVKALCPEAVSVFVLPPSMEVLEDRLRKRGMNSDEDMAVRLSNARDEITASSRFDYVIVNDVLDEAVVDMEAIVRAERRRPCRCRTR